MKNRTLKTAQLLGAATMLAGATHASAQSADAIVNKLLQKGILTQQEADELRKESDKDFAKSFAAKSGSPAWTKNVTFSGDLRLRMDEFWPESSPANGLTSAERLRFRLRLRYGGIWNATDWTTIGVRIASGDERTDSTTKDALGDGNANSNNQTFTHFFSKKPLFLDAAYVTIKPPGCDLFSVTGGKMNKLIWEPSLNSPMVYDPDLTPEGAVEQFNYKFGAHQEFSVFANIGEFVLDEMKSSNGDAYMYDGELGMSAGFLGDPKAPGIKVTVAGGYEFTQNLRKSIPTSDGSGNVGNATAGANYLDNFKVAYARGEAVWKISDHPVLGAPCLLTAGGEYDQNLEVHYRSAALGDQTTAWTGQLMFGNAAKRGQWQVAAQYKYMQADSVLDTLTDDDFGGGTDRKGFVVKASYSIRDWWQVGVAWFQTEKISGRPNSGHNQVGLAGVSQERLFVDTIFKF
jgi:hypothetical protein